MTFYESHFDDYLKSVGANNLHPEFESVFGSFLSSSSSSSAKEEQQQQQKRAKHKNLVFYGPPGTGKYSQVLQYLRHHSASRLKYDKKISVVTDKQSYTYRMSDIHFEIDMCLLGCNSKLMWHEIYSQIVDIVSMRADKKCVIVCKNFHSINPDLLSVFHSYIDVLSPAHVSVAYPSHISIAYIFITEHLGFLPYSILNLCLVAHIPRPSRDAYMSVLLATANAVSADDGGSSVPKKDNVNASIENVRSCDIVNIKELRSFRFIASAPEIPVDNFTVICDEIINDMKTHDTNLSLSLFRDHIYDILIYHLDVPECIWYILESFLSNPQWWRYRGTNADKRTDHEITATVISPIVQAIYPFLKFFNNNYRPIYHLEKMFITMIIHFYGLTD